MKPSAKILGLAGGCFRSMFPQPRQLDEQTTALLARLYPSLDLGRIRYFEGLPWFILGGFVGGITLPATYDTRSIHIYLRKFSPHTEIGLSTIVHEVFHALQYHDLGKGRGVGFFRLFLVHYLSNYIKLFFHYLSKYGLKTADRMAYEFHPMELPAYKQEYEFRYLYKTIGLAAIDAEDFDSCVCENSGYENKAGFGWLVLGYIFTGLVMLAKPLVEILLLLSGSIFWCLGKLLGLLRL